MKRQINQSFIPLILLIGLCHAALAQTYPTKPIRFIAPFVPGAGTDITARTVAQKLTERLGQQVIVDNRPGATGSIGVDITAKAIPDGYTMCLISASHSVSAATSPRLPYDLTKDLAGISQMTALAYFVVVHPSVPVKSIKELVAHARANPGKLNYGSSGTAGLQHFAGVLFGHMTGTDIVHIPYGQGAARDRKQALRRGLRLGEFARYRAALSRRRLGGGGQHAGAVYRPRPLRDRQVAETRQGSEAAAGLAARTRPRPQGRTA